MVKFVYLGSLKCEPGMKNPDYEKMPVVIIPVIDFIGLVIDILIINIFKKVKR